MAATSEQTGVAPIQKQPSELIKSSEEGRFSKLFADISLFVSSINVWSDQKIKPNTQDPELLLLQNDTQLANAGLELCQEKAIESGKVVFSLQEIPIGVSYRTPAGKKVERISEAEVKFEDGTKIAVRSRVLTLQHLPTHVLAKIFEYVQHGPYFDEKHKLVTITRCRAVSQQWRANFSKPTTRTLKIFDIFNSVVEQQKQSPGTGKHNLRAQSGYFDAIGPRRTMEDAHVLFDTFYRNPNRSYYGVYDGHGGKLAAKMTSWYLHHQLASNEQYKRGRIEPAFTEAFRVTDKIICASHDAGDSGTTVAVGHIINRRLFVANCGDAEIVVGQRLENGDMGIASVVQLQS